MGNERCSTDLIVVDCQLFDTFERNKRLQLLYGGDCVVLQNQVDHIGEPSTYFPFIECGLCCEDSDFNGRTK